MKKFISIIAILLAGIALSTEVANAQVAADAAGLQYKKGHLLQNGVKLNSEQALQVLGQETYNQFYKPAKALRISGISLVSVGGGVFAVGAGVFIGAMASKSAGDAFAAMPAVIIMGSGAAIAAVGGVLWGIGDSKMKKIVPAKSGAGLALVF